MDVQVGETYGKLRNDGVCSLYTVVQVKKGIVTLQNVDKPGSIFDTTADKLVRGGYALVSQAPYVALACKGKGRRSRKLSRCPHTVDFIEGRADKEKPSPLPLMAGVDG